MFLTIVICVALSTLRIFAEILSIPNYVVFVINMIALMYVWYVISVKVYDYFAKYKEKDQVWKARFDKYKCFMTFVWVTLILITIIYEILLICIPLIQIVAGCINDIIAIFSLCVSIEDQRLINSIMQHYKKKRIT